MNFVNFLCASAGADLQLLNKCPRTEHIKYMCLGFIIVVITGLAFIFSSYAMIHIFMFKESLSYIENISNYGFALSIGICWAFIVFNFYQLLSSSTGIGDGSTKITSDEFISVVPKVLIVFIFGLALSAPINVWLLHDEIAQVTTESQHKSIKVFEKNIDQRYADNLDSLYNKQVELGDEIQILSKRLTDMKKNASSLVNKKQTWRKIAANEIEFEINKIAEREADLKVLNSTLLETKIQTVKLRAEITSIKKKHASDVIHSVNFNSDLNKVLERHWPLFILSSILIILIHLIPIFIRTVWVKGPYEYLVNFQNSIVIKKYGIVSHASKFGGEWIQRYTVPEAILHFVREQHIGSRNDSNQKLSNWYREEIDPINKSAVI